MASTFGSQLAEQQAQQQQGRTTRTQRKQVFEQQEKSKYRFEQARKEAERLKTEEFIDKDVTTEYQEQYISEYRPRQFSAKEWDRMKGSTKEYWIKVMNSGYGIDHNIKKGRVVPHSYATRTASKTEKDPFTMEDYKFEYSKLSPDVQQFFISPETITTQQEQQKTVERENISSKLTTWQNKIETIQQRKNEYEQWWSRQSSKYRQDESNKKRYKERLKDYELDLDEYRAMTNYLSGEKAKVEEGYSARDLINYAEDKADYDRRRWEAKDKAIGEFNKSLSQGSLDADLVKLGLNKEKLTYNQFVSAVDKYNKDVSYTNQLKQWAGKVGYDKLPAYAQEKINPSALEWQKKYPTEKLVFDKVGNVVGVESGKLGQSVSIEEYNKLSKTPDQLYSEWQKERAKKPLYSTEIPKQETKTPLWKGALSKVTTFVGDALKKTPKLKIPIFIGAGGSIETSKIKEAFIPTIQRAEQDVMNKMVSEVPEKEKVDKKFQEEYQTRFEDKYMRGLIYGDIDFETASKEFEESADAKMVSEKYSSAIDEKSKEMPLLKKWKYGTQLSGLALAEGVTKLIPENYGELAVESAVVYTGYKAITSIPPSINYLLTGGFFTYGTYKAFSPKSTPMEAGSGVITSVVTGVSLAYSGYKWARSPTLKTEDILLKQHAKNTPSLLGKPDTVIVKDVYGKITETKTYQFGRLSTDVAVGRRTILSTKFRDLFGMKPIYKGVPYVEKEAYQKALKKLTDYGYTTSKAKSILRYYQPKILDQELKGVSKLISGDYYKTPVIETQAERITRHPIVTVDKDLGIKTRGATTVKEFIRGRGEVVGAKGDKIIYLNTFDIEKAYLSAQGKLFQRISQAGKTTTQFRQLTVSTSKGEKLLKDIKSFEKGSPFSKLSKDLLIEDIYQKSFARQMIPKTRNLQYSNEKLVALVGEKSTIYVDQQEIYGISAKQLPPKPKVFKGKPIELYTKDDLKLLIKDLKSVYGNQEMKTVLESTRKGTALTIPETSTIQTAGIKSVNIPKTTTQTAKVKIAVKEILNSKNMGAITTGFAMNVKEKLRSRQELKVESSAKERLREMLSLDQASSELLKENQILKQEMSVREALKTSSVFKVPQLAIPLLNIKTPPPTKTKPFTSLFLFGDKDRLKQKIRKKMKATPEIVGLFPDFTARSLGLSPKEMSVKQALKEMQKIQTGFEVRTGGRIKGSKPIDEKSLLKGIMK